MEFNKEEFLKKWRALDPKRRAMIAGGSALAVVVVLGVMFGSPAQNAKQVSKKNPTTNFMAPINKDMSMEAMSAQIDALKNDITDVKKANDRLGVIITDVTKGGSKDAINSDTMRELREMHIEMDRLKLLKPTNETSLDDQLPPSFDANGQLPPTGRPNNFGRAPESGDQSDSSGQKGPQPVAEPDRPKIRVIGGEVKKVDKVASADSGDDDEEAKVYIPAGSNFEGVLLNGMDAPTNGAAKANPTPALIRLDTDAILPSRHRYDIRECFVLVSGFGVMSTERAQLQTTTLSCVKEDGSILESKLEGYVVGEDGKVGMRGRLVTKQGALLARTFVTGFFSGIGQSLAPLAVPQLNVSPGGTQQYQAPNANEMLTAGTAKGVSDTAKSLSQFYLAMAKEMFPVVEIDALRRATIILVKGTELNIRGVTQK